MPNSTTPHNTPFPLWSVNQESPHPERYIPLPTPQSLKDGELFGIPLTSALTGQTVSDNTLEINIQKAISWLEHELRIFITPVEFQESHDYDRIQWTQQFAYFKVNHTPVLDVSALGLRFGNTGTNNIPGNPLNTNQYVNIPNEFIYVTPMDGSIRLVPTSNTQVGNFILSIISGSTFAATVAGRLTYFPGAVQIKYRAGFEQDQVPALIVDLIEKKAAVILLSSLSPVLFPYNSVSTSIDGVSQGVSNGGVNFLSKRIQDLQEQIQIQLEAAKTYYNKRIIFDYV